MRKPMTRAQQQAMFAKKNAGIKGDISGDSPAGMGRITQNNQEQKNLPSKNSMSQSIEYRIETRTKIRDRAKATHADSVKTLKELKAAVEKFPDQKRVGHTLPKKDVADAVKSWESRVKIDEKELDYQNDKLERLKSMK